MNPISMVVWVLAGHLDMVMLFLAAMALIVITLAVREGRHPW